MDQFLILVQCESECVLHCYTVTLPLTQLSPSLYSRPVFTAGYNCIFSVGKLTWARQVVVLQSAVCLTAVCAAAGLLIHSIKTCDSGRHSSELLHVRL